MPDPMGAYLMSPQGQMIMQQMRDYLGMGVPNMGSNPWAGYTPNRTNLLNAMPSYPNGQQANSGVPTAAQEALQRPTIDPIAILAALLGGWKPTF